MKTLKTVRGVITALGGAARVAELTDRGLTAVSNWQCRDGRLPAWSYLVIMEALKARGYDAPAQLWGMAAPGRRRA